MSKKQKEVGRWKVIVLSILSVILFLAIMVLVVVKGFVVKTVKVEGNVLYEDALITSTVLNDEYSWNSLYVYLKYRFLQTDAIPFIDTMEISLENPQTLKIKVYEKGMMGYLYIPAIGENAYFDKDGIVIETSSRDIPDIPRIEGLRCESVVVHEKLPIDGALLRQMLPLTQALKREGLEPEAIRYEDGDKPVLVFESIEVNLGSIELLTQKVERMKVILPQLAGQAGTLHLENFTEESTNIVFKKQD